jgi:hypothetical protein
MATATERRLRQAVVVCPVPLQLGVYRQRSVFERTQELDWRHGFVLAAVGAAVDAERVLVADESDIHVRP